MMVNARKTDTHRKIQLGGLVIKAGLGNADKAVLLGALVELAKDIEAGSAKVSEYKSAGERAFDEGKEVDVI